MPRNAPPPIDEPLYGSSKRIYLADTDAEAMERARSAYKLYRSNFRSPYPEVIGEGLDPTPGTTIRT